MVDVIHYTLHITCHVFHFCVITVYLSFAVNHILHRTRIYDNTHIHAYNHIHVNIHVHFHIHMYVPLPIYMYGFVDICNYMYAGI